MICNVFWFSNILCKILVIDKAVMRLYLNPFKTFILSCVILQTINTAMIYHSWLGFAFSSFFIKESLIFLFSFKIICLILTKWFNLRIWDTFMDSSNCSAPQTFIPRSKPPKLWKNVLLIPNAMPWIPGDLFLKKNVFFFINDVTYHSLMEIFLIYMPKL